MKMKFDRQEQKFYRAYGQGMLDGNSGQNKIKLTTGRWTVFLLVICSPLLFFVIKFGMHLITVRVSGYVEIPVYEAISTEEGYVSQIAVKIGQRIQQGALLCHLDQPELKKQESLIKSELDYLHKNPYKNGKETEAMAKRPQLDLALEHKANMQNRLDEVTRLFNSGAATDAELKLAKFNFEESLAKLADVEASFARAKDTTNMMQTAEATKQDLRIKELALESKKLALQQKALSIFSPTTGNVSEIMAVVGRYVSKGDVLFKIAKNEKTHVTAYLSPEYAEYTTAGQIAEVVFSDGGRVSAKVIASSAASKHPTEDKQIKPGSASANLAVELEFTQPINRKLSNGLPVEVFF